MKSILNADLSLIGTNANESLSQMACPPIVKWKVDDEVVGSRPTGCV